eukprot:6189913-Pleurochrysis_carterae.AAC.2
MGQYGGGKARVLIIQGLDSYGFRGARRDARLMYAMEMGDCERRGRRTVGSPCSSRAWARASVAPLAWACGREAV